MLSDKCISTLNFINLEDVIDIHVESFKGFFLTFLGRRFLRLYYRGVIEDPTGIGFVFLKDGKAAGFVTGFRNPGGFYRQLLRRDWFKFGIASIPGILKKPRSFMRLLRALSKPSKTPRGADVAELSSLAVSPQCQGSGIGKTLIDAFLHEVRTKRVKYVYTTTDALNNKLVNNFYKKSGFNLKRTFQTPEKRLMNEYWYEIRP